jgi:hypothetical protein
LPLPCNSPSSFANAYIGYHVWLTGPRTRTACGLGPVHAFTILGRRPSQRLFFGSGRKRGGNKTHSNTRSFPPPSLCPCSFVHHHLSLTHPHVPIARSRSSSLLPHPSLRFYSRSHSSPLLAHLSSHSCAPLVHHHYSLAPSRVPMVSRSSPFLAHASSCSYGPSRSSPLRAHPSSRSYSPLSFIAITRSPVLPFICHSHSSSLLAHPSSCSHSPSGSSSLLPRPFSRSYGLSFIAIPRSRLLPFLWPLSFIAITRSPLLLFLCRSRSSSLLTRHPPVPVAPLAHHHSLLTPALVA